MPLDGGLAETAATKGLRKAMVYAPWMRLFGGKGVMRKKIRAYMIASSADTSWVTPEVVEGYTTDAARDLGATLDALEGMVRSREPQALVPALGDIRCPVRLVMGAAPHASAVPSEEVALMRAHLPMFAIDSLPNVGHFAFEEDPAALVRVVGRLWVSRTLTALQVTR